MNQEELKAILDKHQLWLNDEEVGERANLRGADLSEADLRWADLRWADLRWADLREADLSEANLRGADLSEADLREADLRWASGNSRELRSLFVSDVYPIAYTSEYLQIGCERHLIKDWWAFGDERIEEMDGQRALDFWAQWKPMLQQLIEQNPATKTGHES